MNTVRVPISADRPSPSPEEPPVHAVSHPEQSSLSSSRLRIGNLRVVVAALTTALLVISGLSLPSPPRG